MRLFRRKETEVRAAEIAVEDDELRRLLINPEQLTVEHALNIPAVASSVNFISSIIAMLPIKLYKESANHSKTEEIADDPRLKLLNDETGDLMDAFQAKKAFIRDYLLSGSGFIYVNKRRNDIISLHYIEKSDISIIKNVDPIFKEARINICGREYLPHDFVIMARNTKDGVCGKGVVDENSKILSAVYNAIIYESKVLGNGGSRKGFLQSERKLGDKEMDDLREKWEEMYSRYGSGVMILNNGIKFTEGSSTAVEMQLFENKKENSEDIFSLFNLSSAVVKGTANAEQNADAVKTALLPPIYEFQTSLNRALLLESEKGSEYFALDTTELLKGDILKRFQAYQTGLAANFLQPDEVRYKEDLPPLGLNFIKLGLNDVLYNPKTGEVYTPNTNQTTNISNKALTNGGEGDILESEKRALDKIVAVDFDNTLAITRYPEIIAPIPHNIELVRQLKAEGATIILWTCREGKALADALVWCGQQGVPIDYVNENAPGNIERFGNDCRKIAADIYIDDKNYTEDRAHWIKDDKGLFAGSVSDGGGGAAVSGSDKTTESGISDKHTETTGENTVDLEYIKSKEFRNKFYGITGNPKVDEQIYSQAKAQLIHCNGTYKEDLCLIDSTTGEIKGKQTKSKAKFGVIYNSSLDKAVSSCKPNSLISVHNHPTNNPPTGSDLASCGYHQYNMGVVTTHKGAVFTYKVGGKSFHSQSFSKTVDNYRKKGYNEIEAIKQTLNRFKADYGIEWSER